MLDVKAESKVLDDRRKQCVAPDSSDPIADEDNAQPDVVYVSDAEILAAGRSTRRGLVFVAFVMFVFCLSLMAYFAAQLGETVGGECDASQGHYRNYNHCWNLKENWCAQMQCSASGQAMGTAIDPASLDASDPSVCPQGCSVCGTEDGQTEKWVGQLKRFDSCRKRTSRVRECLPTMDFDGSLANYRGYKTAHPMSQQGAAEAFIIRDAFLDACDAQEVFADRRERGGWFVVMAIGFAALVWLILCGYLCRTPDYKKKPRETEMPDLSKWQDRTAFRHRFHPRSAWLYYNTANNLFGFVVQLYSFYTPSSTTILVPIFQGAWMTIMVVARGILVFRELYRISEAASILFDIGFAAIGFSAVLEPFFEPLVADTSRLPEADLSLTDWALTVRVFSFVWPLVSSAGGVRDLYKDVYWPSPATARALRRRAAVVPTESSEGSGPTGALGAKGGGVPRWAKALIFGLQLLAALSVYVVMASPRWCHEFRTCQRKTTCDPLGGDLLGRMPLDGFSVIAANKVQRAEMISDDGSKKWRWQINTQTELSFIKDEGSGKVYADLTFAIPNGAIENKVSTPGSGGEDTVAGVTPSSACATRFEVQCHEQNPRHAFATETGPWDWVAYNASTYKFVARHDAGASSGEPSCFGPNAGWWTPSAMFSAGLDLQIGDGDGEAKTGFVFMEQECDSADSDQPAGCSNMQNAANACRTKNCLVEPAYVASYAPYGRASVSGSWSYTWGGGAVPTTWATTQRVFELDVSELKLGEAAKQAGASGAGGQQLGGQPPPGGSGPQLSPDGGGQEGCAEPPDCGTPEVNPPCCTR